jgi:ferredoxin-like protein FixX
MIHGTEEKTKLTEASPYAAEAIQIFLTSETGMRYRQLSCIECGVDFIERAGDTLYRLGDSDNPEAVALSDLPVDTHCSNCKQQYELHVALSVGLNEGGIPLYMQPQTIYIDVAQSKKLRYVHCLECGKSFHTISDRVSVISDNRVPVEYLDPTKAGPMEAICRFNNCSQLWAFMVR